MIDIKVMIFGGGLSGKTSILNRYFQGFFIEGIPPTIQDVFEKQIEFEGRSIKLECVDQCGQDDYYIENWADFIICDFIIFVFDLSDAGTIKILDSYINEIKKSFKKRKQKLLYSIAGNKLDLNANPNFIDQIQIETIEKKYNQKIIKTSAKENINIDFLFNDTIKKMIDDRENVNKKCFIQ